MFTVKHRAADGTETLYSAEKIEVVHNGDHFDDGIYLDPEISDPQALAARNPGEQRVVRFAKSVILFGGPQTEEAQKRMGSKVWIMHEAGNTVAAYDL